MEMFKIFLLPSAEPVLFHSGTFLGMFALFLIVYSFTFSVVRWRNIVTLFFGLFFYYKSSGAFVILLLSCISMDYLFAKMLENSQRGGLYKKMILGVAICISLIPLIYFKYYNFMFSEIFELSQPSSLVLPVGISFYTFQSISFLVDIYTGRIKNIEYMDYLFYMTFFPHLVGGPIVRATDFVDQINQPTTLNFDALQCALFLILKGLVKKALIADFVAQYSDLVFADPSGFSGSELLLGVFCYGLQIFCDFSGYTDMAIGIAAILGFKLGVNFDSPYKALNISVFWRKWHISLSSWLKDYVYIPLGGNKKGQLMQSVFLLVTMVIGGLWHGASWKFLIWGAGHGLLLIIHKYFLKLGIDGENVIGNFLKWLATFVAVLVLWIPFRANNLSDSVLIFNKIVLDQNFKIWSSLIQTNSLLFVILVGGYFLAVMKNSTKEYLKSEFVQLGYLGKMALAVVLVQLILQIKSESVQPFIYFQF